MNRKCSKPIIMIIDDEPENIRILSAILKPEYRIMAATGGAEAIDLIASGRKPHLIFLDIMMPDMDGYEVCRYLKRDPATASVPVIFITALNGSENEIRGLAAGAADYITKPFHEDIVRARAEVHIELKLHRDHLEELARERADHLLHSERLATLGTLSAGIMHEISNQLYPLTLNIELLQDKFNALLPFISHAVQNRDADRGNSLSIVLDIHHSLDTALQAGDRLIGFINSMKGFARRDSSEKEPVSIKKCFENALMLCKSALKFHIRIIRHLDESIPDFNGNAGRIEQVLINLIKNASDAMKNESEGMLLVTASHNPSQITIIIEDNGPGIPEETLETIWEPFFTTKDAKGLGLGLSITKQIIEDHGGNIHAENRREGGARFVIELPLKEESFRSFQNSTSGTEHKFTIQNAVHA